MSYLDTASGQIVAQAPELERAAFIRRTYIHLAGAILAFAGLTGMLLRAGVGEQVMTMLAASRWSWLIVLAVFMGVSVLADRWARHDYSREVQYLGLGLYVVAEAVIFLPLLYIASTYAPGVIQSAAMITLALAGGLTFTAFTTRKNFSFLAPALSIGGFVALGVIVASIAFGFQLGLLFSGLMIVFAGGSILYTTSNMIHEYRTDQHVAASLGLFASVGLMFWYVVQFLMSMAGGD
jgi:FtsH-binding integral membrane protein